MDLESFVSVSAFLVLTCFLLATLLVTFSADPPLPGPHLIDYLPGGVTFQLFRDTRSASSVMYQLLERYGDIFNLWLGPIRVVITAVPEDVAQIISTADCFSRPPPVRSIFSVLASGGLFESAGAKHAAIRKNMLKRFNHSMLQSFEPKLNEAVKELCSKVNEWVGKGPVELGDYVGLTTFRVITNVAFGSEMGADERIAFNKSLNELVDEMLKEVIWYPIRQALTVLGTRNSFLNLGKSLRDSCRVFTEKRLSETTDEKASRAPDMLDTYLETCQGDIELAISLSFESAIAGNHTTNQIITWALYELCCNPRVRNKLDRELDSACAHKPPSEALTLQEVKSLEYVNQIWKEVLRRRPLSSAVMRTATRDVVLKGSGLRIRKGSAVSAFFGASHLNPQVWKNPLEFRPERWNGDRQSEGHRTPPGTYIPFGAGGYSCAGRFLADYEGPLILAELCRRFSFQLGCGPEEVKTRSLFVDSARYIVGKEESGVPFVVSLRH